jgi:hypothetical protein
VIGSVLPRGRDVGGLLRYLFREGRAGERGLAADHNAPRLIAAWDSDLTRLEPGETVAGRRDVRALAAALSAPVRAANVDPATKPVYHLAIAAAKDPRTGKMLDKHLSDGQWADIAVEYLHQLGLAPRGMSRRCGGWRCGTPMTTSTSSRPWRGRTAVGCSRATTTTGRGRPA